MPKSKRLRVFAGPNGSGKSTLFAEISNNFPTGPFINSDAIEAIISKTGFLNLSEYGLSLNQGQLEDFYRLPATVSLLNKAEEIGRPVDIVIKENVIVDKSKNTHSYEAALITSFLRHHITRKGISYSFESVMSHPSKLDEIAAAKAEGYHTYFYFVCLDDPLLNISRVHNRVEKGGHAVPDQKIVDRYKRVLDLLLPALSICKKCYLFDNSSEHMRLIAKVESGQLTILVEENELPNWFIESVINKSIEE